MQKGVAISPNDLPHCDPVCDIVDAFNRLITRNWNGRKAVFLPEQFNPRKQYEYMDVESAISSFRNAGWKVAIVGGEYVFEKQ
jgi:hypothetical protein